MAASAVPAAPPQGSPPVILTEDWSAWPDGPWNGGQVANGRLMLPAADGQSIASTWLYARSLREVIIDLTVSLAAGSEDDLVGLYLRQGAPDRYIICGYSPSGQIGMFAMDGPIRKPIVQGVLAPDLPFNRGVGQANRCTVVACGPNITFVLNGAVAAGAYVDPRYKSGHAGVVLAPAAGGPARAEFGWAQIRSVLADQEPGPGD